MQLLAMNLGRTDDWIIVRPFCKSVGVLRLQFFPVALREVRKVLKWFFKISASLCNMLLLPTHISLFSEYLGKLCVEVQGSFQDASNGGGMVVSGRVRTCIIDQHHLRTWWWGAEDTPSLFPACPCYPPVSTGVEQELSQYFLEMLLKWESGCKECQVLCSNNSRSN